MLETATTTNAVPGESAETRTTGKRQKMFEVALTYLPWFVPPLAVTVWMLMDARRPGRAKEHKE